MRGVRTLKDLFPEPQPPVNKNFIKENVKSLRKMEKLFHTNKSVRDQKFPVLKQTKVVAKNNSMKNNQNSKNESSQVLKPEEIIENGIANLLNKSFLEHQTNRKKSAPAISSKKIILKNTKHPVNRNIIKKNHECKQQVNDKTKYQKNIKAFSDENLSKENSTNNDLKISCKSQGVQTLNADDVNSIYSDGVIRYPSGKNKELQTEKSMDRGDDTQLPEENEFSDIKQNSQQSLIDVDDHIKLSKDRGTLANKLASQLNSASSPNHKVGVVPKYIKERKQALQKEQQAKAAAKHADCPLGHIPLPDSERKETLSMLKKNYQDYVRELNMLPIRTDTLRSQKRKMEIEKQLAKLEEAIKVFSRPKVFVKVDA